MRYRRLSAGLLVCFLLPACGSKAGLLPLGTFVDQTGQVLELKLDPSQTTNVFIRVSIETGVNKYFGKSVGTYVLRSTGSVVTGTFVWAKSPRGILREVWFTADTGVHWSVKVEPDGSLVDSSGTIWKTQSTSA